MFGVFGDVKATLDWLMFTHFFERLAGAVGFEPTIHDTKNRCLTTWPRPSNTSSLREELPSDLSQAERDYSDHIIADQSKKADLLC